MKTLGALLAFLVLATPAYNAGVVHVAPSGVLFVKESDFDGVRRVKESDFIKPWPEYAPTPAVVKPVADPFSEAYQRATRENKPLVVWVGYACSSSEKQLPALIHVHLPMPWRDISKPSIVGLMPGVRGTSTEGWLLRVGAMPADQVCAKGIVDLFAVSSRVQHSSHGSGNVVRAVACSGPG